MRENQTTDPRSTQGNEPETSKGKQQQTDPQKTELKGFIDSSEDLEPTLEDGTKAPDKEPKGNERGAD